MNELHHYCTLCQLKKLAFLICIWSLVSSHFAFAESHDTTNQLINDVSVLDINTSSDKRYSSYPQNFVEFDGKLFFTADPNEDWHSSTLNVQHNEDLIGQELYVYDEEAGVRLFADLLPVAVDNDTRFVGSSPRSLTVYNGSLYFLADTSEELVGLYRVSDGDSMPEFLMYVGEGEIIRVDGTEAASGSDATNALLYLFYNDSELGWVIESYDESSNSTSLIMEVEGGENRKYLYHLLTHQNQIYYRFSHDLRVIDLNTLTNLDFLDKLNQDLDSGIDFIDSAGLNHFSAGPEGLVYFLAYPNNAQSFYDLSLYTYDSQTNVVTRISGAGTCDAVGSFVFADEELYLIKVDQNSDLRDSGQLWRFDEANEVCELLTDNIPYGSDIDQTFIDPFAEENVLPFPPLFFDNKLLYVTNHRTQNPFSVDVQLNTIELDNYQVTSTESTSQRNSEEFVYHTEFQGQLYLSMLTEVGNELLRFNSELNELEVVADINQVTVSSNPQNKVIYNNALYFTADMSVGESQSSRMLMRMDLQENDIVAVASDGSDRIPDNPDNLLIHDDKLLFTFEEGVGIYHESTQTVTTITEFFRGEDSVEESIPPTKLIMLNDTVFVTADESLWILDIEENRIQWLSDNCCHDLVIHNDILFSFYRNAESLWQVQVWQESADGTESDREVRINAEYDLSAIGIDDWEASYNFAPSDQGIYIVGRETLDLASFFSFSTEEITDLGPLCCGGDTAGRFHYGLKDWTIFEDRFYHHLNGIGLVVYDPESPDNNYDFIAQDGTERDIPFGDSISVLNNRLYFLADEVLWRLSNSLDENEQIAQFAFSNFVERVRYDAPSAEFNSYNLWRVDPDMIFYNGNVYLTAEMPGVGTELVRVFIGRDPEIAIAAPDSVKAGFRGFVDASATNAGDDETLFFDWQQISGPAVALSNANTPYLSFHVPSNTPDGSELTFSLDVVGTTGNSTQEVSILVINNHMVKAENYVPQDFDGDNIADIAFRTPENFTQTIYDLRGDSKFNFVFGRNSMDIPVSGDFDGDGIADFAVRRGSAKIWYISNSSGSNFNSSRGDGIQRINFGRQAHDIPVPADYDGDGITDVAVYRLNPRQTAHWWYIKNSSGSNFNSPRGDGIQRLRFGVLLEDIPVPGDYDGDGKADIAVVRLSEGTWFIKNSSGTAFNSHNGLDEQRITMDMELSDIPVTADFDGDGITDIGFRRPSATMWRVLLSSTGQIIESRFGKQVEDIPVVADYDGDGKADFAVRRPSENMFFIRRSSDNGIERVSVANGADIPLAAPDSVIREMIGH